MCVKSLFVTTLTVDHQAPPSMVFSRQEYWSHSHALLQGIEPVSLRSPALAGGFFTTSWEVLSTTYTMLKLRMIVFLLFYPTMVSLNLMVCEYPSAVLRRNTLQYICGVLNCHKFSLIRVQEVK